MSSGQKRRLDFATAPTIIRANQKDSYYQNVVLFKQVENTIRVFKGSAFIHMHSGTIKRLVNLLYLGITTLVGARTLGEEYVDLHYMNRDGRRLPKLMQRLAFILSYIGGSVLFKWFLSKMQQLTRNEKRINSQHDGFMQIVKQKLLTSVYKSAKCLESVNWGDMLNLHLALFYFSGRYYQFSKRLFGLRYALGYRVDPRSRQAKGNYELLGLLILAQLAIKYALKMSWLIKDKEPDENSHSTDVSSSDIIVKVPAVIPNEDTDVLIDLSDPKKLPYVKGSSRSCMLCLSPMKDPTCAPCGHLFCWKCIFDWCKEREECPLCRSALREAQLLPLR